jgi:hypothetical protein
LSFPFYVLVYNEKTFADANGNQNCLYFRACFEICPEEAAERR